MNLIKLILFENKTKDSFVTYLGSYQANNTAFVPFINHLSMNAILSKKALTYFQVKWSSLNSSCLITNLQNHPRDQWMKYKLQKVQKFNLHHILSRNIDHHSNWLRIITLEKKIIAKILLSLLTSSWAIYTLAYYMINS